VFLEGYLDKIPPLGEEDPLAGVGVYPLSPASQSSSP